MFFGDAGQFFVSLSARSACQPESCPLLSSPGWDLKNVCWGSLFNLWRKEMFLLGLKAPEEMVSPALAHPSQGSCSLAEGKCSSVGFMASSLLIKGDFCRGPCISLPSHTPILCWPPAVSSCVCLLSQSSGKRMLLFPFDPQHCCSAQHLAPRSTTGSS